MGRPRSHRTGKAAVRANSALQREFADLHEAISDWLDGGDFNAIDMALDVVQNSADYYEYDSIRDDLARDERIVLLGQRLATASQLATRLGRELRAVEKARAEIRDQLLATIAEPADVPEYVVRLWRRLQAEGASQSDLQPQSKALAKAMLDAARAHNDSRKSGALQNEEEDEPITTWVELPREFAGFRLRDVGPDEAVDFDICPLPPWTDIAYFTVDGQRPAIKPTRRETIIAWSKIIEGWCTQNGRKLSAMHAAAWAMLLGHRLDHDDSNLSNLNGIELQSPWDEEGIVVFESLPLPRSAPAREDDDEDDVPY